MIQLKILSFFNNQHTLHLICPYTVFLFFILSFSDLFFIFSQLLFVSVPFCSVLSVSVHYCPFLWVLFCIFPFLIFFLSIYACVSSVFWNLVSVHFVRFVCNCPFFCSFLSLFFLFLLCFSPFEDFLVSVLLSAHIKLLSVFCMQDF